MIWLTEIKTVILKQVHWGYMLEIKTKALYLVENIF